VIEPSNPQAAHMARVMDGLAQKEREKMELYAQRDAEAQVGAPLDTHTPTRRR
jgi:hypothetical protein